jgi:S2P endopeptidase
MRIVSMRGNVNALADFMSFVYPLLVLALTWAFIYAFRYFFTLSRSNPLSLSASNTFRFRGNGFWDHSTTQVSLKSFHLRLQTTAWNVQHDILATKLGRERSLFFSQALRGFYDLGSAFGMLGMLAGLVLLSWSCSLSTLSLTRKITRNNATPDSVSRELARRGFEGTAILLPEYESYIKPIVSHLTLVGSN